MIPVQKPPKAPDKFSDSANKGLAWLDKRIRKKKELPASSKIPSKYWSQFIDKLAPSYVLDCGPIQIKMQQVCCYSGIRVEPKQCNVDHYYPKSADLSKLESELKSLGWSKGQDIPSKDKISWYQEQKIFNWENYRYAESTVNQHYKGEKGPGVVVDPYDVESDWFELDLVTGRLKVLPIPKDCKPEEAQKRKIAAITLEEKGLNLNDGLFVRGRVRWIEYILLGTPLAVVDQEYPLISLYLRTKIMAISQNTPINEQELRELFSPNQKVTDGAMELLLKTLVDENLLVADPNNTGSYLCNPAVHPWKKI